MAQIFIITLKDALHSARAAAIPDIPPPITMTEGGISRLSICEMKAPRQEGKKIRIMP